MGFFLWQSETLYRDAVLTPASTEALEQEEPEAIVVILIFRFGQCGIGTNDIAATGEQKIPSQTSDYYYSPRIRGFA
jgi:hypothetical protein